jgi:O-methyltransferase involved in polyketide biosynthesis
MFPIALASVAAAGEPWISFFEPDELASRLEELGFHRIEHLDPAGANERYFAGRGDGLRVTSGEHLMRVRLK